MTAEQRTNAVALLAFFEDEATERQCDMSHWVMRWDDLALPPKDQRGTPECGTAACLAGWGALLLAPTEDYREDGWERANAYHRMSVLVPTGWAEEHKVMQRSGAFVPIGMSRVHVMDIGKAVLGYELAGYFSDQDGPSNCHLSDRRWMISVLRKELGMTYNEVIDEPAEPSEYDHEDYDDDYDDDE